jgi:hypothetical protein
MSIRGTRLIVEITVVGEVIISQVIFVITVVSVVINGAIGSRKVIAIPVMLALFIGIESRPTIGRMLRSICSVVDFVDGFVR